MKGVALSVEEKKVKDDSRIMKLTKYLEEGVYEILYDESMSAVQCSCKKFESRGVPCSHRRCLADKFHTMKGSTESMEVT